jgi:hypothetical protein
VLNSYWQNLKIEKPKNSVNTQKLGAVLLACAFLAACGARPILHTANQSKVKAVASNPYAPKPDDAKRTRGTIQIDTATLANSSVKSTFTLTITGSLPTPCHELRLQIHDNPDAQGVFQVDAWSVFDPAQMCAQMLQPFSVQVEIPARNENLKLMLNGKLISQ